MRATIGASNNFKGYGMIKNKEQMAESIAAVWVMAFEAKIDGVQRLDLEDVLDFIMLKLDIDSSLVDEYELLMINGGNDGR